MKIPQAIINIAEICAQHRLREVILSPGSRNAPLTLSFSRHPKMNTRVLHDERSAGYVALGMSQALKYPVILICTSGTAALNYAPAVAEALFQETPLLIMTADRPPEWIDQKDGQTIRQRGMFGDHAKKSFELPVAVDHPDVVWHIHRLINDAIITSQEDPPGPVHLNIPLREPLYQSPQEPWEYQLDLPVKRSFPVKHALAQLHWNQLLEAFHSYSKVLVICGQAPLNSVLHEHFDLFVKNTGIPVAGDAIANLHHLDHAINHLEIILGQGEKHQETLRPELLISCGGAVISKNLKKFLRKFPPKAHWHIQKSGLAADTFQSMTRVIPLEAADFFQGIREVKRAPSDWSRHWQQQELWARDFLNEQLSGLPFNEMSAVKAVLDQLPSCKLHVANSMPVRWVDLLGVPSNNIEIWANRGTSGIDGCNSTAVGHSLVDDQLQVLLTGDMAFCYDHNAFWHSYPLPNLKIIVLNNQGGGIFRLIDGPSQQPECQEYFVTSQKVSAAHTAKQFGFGYLYCDNMQSLSEMMDKLYQTQPQACVLEIALPNNMGQIYKNFMDTLKNNHEQR